MSWFRMRTCILFIFSVAMCDKIIAFEEFIVGGFSVSPTIEMRLGLQQGEGINFGYGAIDDPADKTRTSASISLEPTVAYEKNLGGGTFYGSASVVGATNIFDGEISGQWAKSGDSRVDIDVFNFGWRNQTLDLSLGPQKFVVGDGLVLGDGNFDIGSGQGQFWVAPFDAWKNSVVLRFHHKTIDTELFWLRSDGGWGDARLGGVNVHSSDTEFGRYGAMYINIYRGNLMSYDGVQAWNLRALDVPVFFSKNLRLFAEVVYQVGQDTDGASRKNRGLGWYTEADYSFSVFGTAAVLAYRYARFSGDDLDTLNNESYRSLFYGFYTREWDTFYQGEIAGEYHLFNSNQETQFIKLKILPTEKFALTTYYFQHDLEEANYYGTKTSSKNWANEINVGVEYFNGEKVYIYAGVAWSTPNAAARQIFGSKEFTVIQTWMSFHF